jgi:N,N'-diacetyllegionaminate synthase
MVFILAEAGVNHNGKLNLALQLVDIAKESGADAIKFQTFKANKLVSKKAEKAEYQKETTDSNESQFDMLKKLELSYEDFQEIYTYCEKVGIEFISTPFDLESAELLNKLNVKTYKIGSGDLTNYPLLRYVAKKEKKMILSTGMSNLNEVIDSVNYVIKNGCPEVVVLHCISNYPTKNEDLNLKAIRTMIEKLNENNNKRIEIGFSDHTKGLDASIYSVFVGATYIEKHYTIDKEMEGPDHRASLNPEELYNFVKKIRDAEIMLGDGVKKFRNSEIENRTIIRRSLAYNTKLSKGHKINYDDLITLRPNKGVCGSKLEEFIGKTLKKDINENEFLDYKDFE